MYSEVNEMTNMIVIAELTKGNVNPSTAELVSAAKAMGGDVTVVVPCTDASMADGVSSYDGVSKVIAVSTSFPFSSLSSCPASCSI